MVNDDTRLYIAELLEARLDERKMPAVFKASAHYFKRTLKDGAVPSVYVVQRILEEMGCLAMAEAGSKWKYLASIKAFCTAIADAGTIHKDKVQTLGVQYPEYNDDASIKCHRRLMFGIGKVLQSDGSSLLLVCQHLVKDIINSYNFIYGGDEGIDSSDDEDDPEVAKRRGMTTYDVPEGLIRPDEDSEDEITAQRMREQDDWDHQPREGMMSLAEVLCTICATLSDHGEHVMWNHLIPWFNKIAGKRGEIQAWVKATFVRRDMAAACLGVKGHCVLMTAARTTFSVLPDYHVMFAGQLSEIVIASNDVYKSKWVDFHTSKPVKIRSADMRCLPVALRERIARLAFGDLAVDFAVLSRKGFFCFYHKLAKGTERAMTAIALEEELIRKELGVDPTVTNLVAKNGSLTTAIIVSASKAGGRTQYHDESLSKGKIMGSIRKHMAEEEADDAVKHDKIHHTRIMGSRGDVAIMDAALGTLRFMRCEAKWNLEALIRAFAGGSVTNSLDRSLLWAIADVTTDAVLKVMVFLFFAIVHPFHKFCEHPASTQLDMRDATLDYRDVLVRCTTHVGPIEDLDGWLLQPAKGKTALLKICFHDRVYGKNSQERRELAMSFVFGKARGSKCPAREGEVGEDAAHVRETRILNKAAAGFVASLDNLTGEGQGENGWGGELLTCALDSKYAKKAAKVAAAAVNCEGFVGEVSYCRGRNPQQKMRNLHFQLMMGEVGLCAKLRFLQKHYEQLFHEIMARARAFRRIHVPRIKAREKTKLKVKEKALDVDLQKSQALMEKRDEEKDKREKVATSYGRTLRWATMCTGLRKHGTHTFPGTASLVVHERFIKEMLQELFGRTTGTRASCWKCVHLQAKGKCCDWLNEKLEMFHKVHKCNTIPELQPVFYPAHRLGSGVVAIRKHAGVELQAWQLAKNLAQVQKYYMTHGSPIRFEQDQSTHEVRDEVYAEHDALRAWVKGQIASTGHDDTSGLYNVCYDDDAGLDMSTNLQPQKIVSTLEYIAEQSEERELDVLEDACHVASAVAAIVWKNEDTAGLDFAQRASGAHARQEKKKAAKEKAAKATAARRAKRAAQAAAAAEAEEVAMEVEANAPTPSPTLPTSPTRTGDPLASSTSSGGEAPTLPPSSPPPEAPLVVVSSVPSPAPAPAEEPRQGRRVRKKTSQWRPDDAAGEDQWSHKG